MDFESEKVHTIVNTSKFYFCTQALSPFTFTVWSNIYQISLTPSAELHVESVVALTTQEDNITVAWEPVEYTGSFYYRLKWTNRRGLQYITTQETMYTIYDLDPGSRHLL